MMECPRVNLLVSSEGVVIGVRLTLPCKFSRGNREIPVLQLSQAHHYNAGDVCSVLYQSLMRPRKLEDEALVTYQAVNE